MNSLNNNDSDSVSRQFTQLLQVIREDSAINKKLLQLLKLDSYQRRNVLNRWLEHLRLIGAAENLLRSLSCLFDDEVAEKTLSQLNK